MLEFIVAFIYSICAAALLTFLYDALMPESDLKKYCGVALSILIVALLTAPVVSLLSGDALISEFDFSALKSNYEDVTILDYEDFINKAYQNSLLHND